MMMDVRAIHNESDYEWALREIEAYFDSIPARGTPEADRFDVLAAIIKDYENQTIEVPDVDPVDVLHFAIESLGRTQAQLATIVGSRSRASEILNRKRRLTIDMIRDISNAWSLPVGTLTGSYHLKKESA
ncbi:MAG TPA: helix-turn-helix domain-containing protein [Xanthobacteraceae bacterium]|nr:helix-turn-helix domain-containing protein [Xanthobacteraceae bacterium]